MKKMNFLFLAVLVISLIGSGCAVGIKKGVVYEKKPDGSTGMGVPNVEIVFTSEDNNTIRTITTNNGGGYKILLPAKRYYIEVDHPGFQAYSNTPGFSAVVAGETTTRNIFLEKP